MSNVIAAGVSREQPLPTVEKLLAAWGFPGPHECLVGPAHGSPREVAEAVARRLCMQWLGTTIPLAELARTIAARERRVDADEVVGRAVAKLLTRIERAEPAELVALCVAEGSWRTWDDARLRAFVWITAKRVAIDLARERDRVRAPCEAPLYRLEDEVLDDRERREAELVVGGAEPHRLPELTAFLDTDQAVATWSVLVGGRAPSATVVRRAATAAVVHAAAHQLPPGRITEVWRAELGLDAPPALAAALVLGWAGARSCPRRSASVGLSAVDSRRALGIERHRAAYAADLAMWADAEGSLAGWARRRGVAAALAHRLLAAKVVGVDVDPLLEEFGWTRATLHQLWSGRGASVVRSVAVAERFHTLLFGRGPAQRRFQDGSCTCS